MAARPHVILLRNPWQWRDRDATTAEEGDGPRAERWFHSPPHLSPRTSVTLVVHGLTSLYRVRLNGRQLPGQQRPPGEWRSAIGEHLETRNHLELEFDAATSVAAQDRLRELLATGHVRLELDEESLCTTT